jgi:CBS domain-containing protein
MPEPEHLKEDLERYHEEAREPKAFDSETLLEPLKHLRLRAPKPLVSEASETVAVAADRMGEKKVGCILVVKEGKVVGICSERDVIQKVLCTGADPSGVRVEEIMTPEPECLQPDDSVAFALHLMHIGGYRHVPLVNEEHEPVGIVSVKDIVDHIVEHFPEEVYNLPPRPMRRGPGSREGG